MSHFSQYYFFPIIMPKSNFAHPYYGVDCGHRGKTILVYHPNRKASPRPVFQPKVLSLPSDKVSPCAPPESDKPKLVLADSHQNLFKAKCPARTVSEKSFMSLRLKALKARPTPRL